MSAAPRVPARIVGTVMLGTTLNPLNSSIIALALVDVSRRLRRDAGRGGVARHRVLRRRGVRPAGDGPPRGPLRPAARVRRRAVDRGGGEPGRAARPVAAVARAGADGARRSAPPRRSRPAWRWSGRSRGRARRRPARSARCRSPRTGWRPSGRSSAGSPSRWPGGRRSSSSTCRSPSRGSSSRACGCRRCRGPITPALTTGGAPSRCSPCPRCAASTPASSP